ncbi:MAG TPA: ABC-type transport auxiliary lipoprotein family protein [Candidatus Methanoperedens sp.]|nr:ABC-type transport auxiliary lipoprotein family protein [Candidatus Methanoperedens sp.]
MKAAFVCVVAALALAGCAGLAHQAAPTVWLALEPAPLHGGLRPGGPSVEVARFATAAPFATDRLASREGAGRWSFAAYHRWVADPGGMVSSRLREALSCADLFGAVFTPPAPLDAGYRLSGAVRGLYWDREAGRAVLELEASLLAAPDRLAGFWVRRAVVPVRGDTVGDFVAAASTAQVEVLGWLRAELARALAADAVPAAGPRSSAGQPDAPGTPYFRSLR